MLLERRAQMFKHGGRLPSEYQEVSYIGTSNTTSKTHIDTGVVLQSVFTINAKVLWHTVPTSGAYQYHGHFNSGSSVQFGVPASATHYVSSTAGGNALSSGIAATANTIYNIKLKADGTTLTFTVNETTVTRNYTFGATNPYTSFIFGRNGNTTYRNTWVNGKVYSYDIYKDNVLVRNYVPCYRKADNVIGLYDLCGSICPLTGTPFYINAGSGTFTKGVNV